MINVNYLKTYKNTDYLSLFEEIQIELAMLNLQNIEMRCIEEQNFLINNKEDKTLILETANEYELVEELTNRVNVTHPRAGKAGQQKHIQNPEYKKPESNNNNNENQNNSVTVNNSAVTTNEDNNNENGQNNSVVKRGWEVVKNTISKIANFITNAVNKFINKAKDLFNSIKNEFKSNKEAIQNVNQDFWSNCTITFYPYFDKGITRFQNSIFSNQGIGFINLDNKTSVNNLLDMMASGSNDIDIIKKISNTVAKNFNENTSFSEACKITYRNSKETKKYSGAEAKTLCDNINIFLENYDSISNSIKSESEKIKKDLDNINRMINNGQYDKVIEELNVVFSEDERLFSLLENKYIYNLASMENLNIINTQGSEILILTEKRNGWKNTGWGNRGRSKETTKASSGSVDIGNSVNNTNNNTQNQTNSSNNQNVNQTRAKNKLKLYSYAIEAITARMTISEEIFNDSVKIINTIINQSTKNSQSQEQNENKKSGLTGNLFK